MITIDDYDYFLPPELIANSPTIPRDHCRLLMYSKTTKLINHGHFYDLADQLTSNDVLILNQTKVFPARLFGYKQTGGKVELLLLSASTDTQWRAITKPGLKVGTILLFDHQLTFEVIAFYPETGEVDINANQSYYQLLTTLDSIGHTPLPPYIKTDTSESILRRQYQTIYALNPGSAAAPTAGLQFTPKLLAKIKAKGVEVEYLTLHVGLGTFQPLRPSNIISKKLHHESYEIEPDTMERLNIAKKQGKRLIAVGTTTVRALEGYAKTKKLSGETDLFIYPPYQFKYVDSLITNFHLPKSSLLMLVAAIAGPLKDVYQTAIDQKYRFFSFGDAMWIY